MKNKSENRSMTEGGYLEATPFLRSPYFKQYSATILWNYRFLFVGNFVGDLALAVGSTGSLV